MVWIVLLGIWEQRQEGLFANVEYKEKGRGQKLSIL